MPDVCSGCNISEKTNMAWSVEGFFNFLTTCLKQTFIDDLLIVTTRVLFIMGTYV